MDARAASRSVSPMNAETRIFPEGTVNENSPSEFESVYPIGIQ